MYGSMSKSRSGDGRSLKDQLWDKVTGRGSSSMPYSRVSDHGMHLMRVDSVSAAAEQWLLRYDDCNNMANTRSRWMTRSRGASW